jgi:hypothetical protein
MTKLPRPPIAEILRDSQRIEAAVRQAIRTAVVAQAKLGYPVAGWRNGQVVWLEPAEILATLADSPELTQKPATQP